MVHPALNFLWVYRKTFITLLTPLVLLPLPLVPGTKEAACGYVILLMAIYWITEAVPLAVTALIPVILFPIMGVLKAKDVGPLYFKDTNWLLTGGLIIAVAVETSGLHKRIALRVLLFTGVRPRWLMLGFMLVTFFLSMWISNTASTAMLVPIAEAVIKKLYEEGPQTEGEKVKQVEGGKKEGDHCYDNPALDTIDEIEEETPNIEENGVKSDQESAEKTENGAITTTDIQVDVERKQSVSEGEDSDELHISDKKKEFIIKGITICVPYAASIGGTATLTGTAPNLVLSGQYEVIFPDASPNLSFGIWITYCLPQAIVMLILAYFWLSCWFIGFDLRDMCRCCTRRNKSKAELRATAVIQNQYDQLGNIKWEEITVIVVFGITVLLWFFRDPGYMPGWTEGFLAGYVSDGTVAITMAFTLFVLPRKKPDFLKRLERNYTHEDEDKKFKSHPAVLDWRTTQKMFPWDVVLLLGSGFAVAEAATKSGLSAWFGEQLAVLKGIDDWAICLIITTFICLMTETTSNTATTTLFVPILAELAKTLEIHPLYITLPPVVAASLAFMLPVATPPNAIAFSYGRIKVLDLIKAGWMVNILGILTITLFINTYGVAFFNLREFPAWANETLAQTPATTAAPCFFNST